MGISVSSRGIANLVGDAIRVVFPVAQEIVIDHANDSIKIGDGSTIADVTDANALKTDSSHVTQPVSALALPLPLGASTEVKQDTGNTRTGDLTETAPATDTASSGLNGRLQRLAQRLTSLIALVPASLGQKLMANSFAITLPSDQSYGYTSTGNSSTEALGVSGVFTGTFEEVKDYAFLSFSVISNVSSAVDGLEFQWSSNGTDIDRIETTNLIGGANGRAFSFAIRARYFRIKYTNGITGQTSFRLSTVYHVNGTGIITKTLKASVNGDNFAQLVQSPIMARLMDDTYSNIAGIKLDSTALLGIADTTAIMGNQGNAFKVSTNRLSTGQSSERAFLLINNPSASGKILRIDKIIFVGTEVVDTGVTFRVYLSPTVTANGTALTPVGNRQTGQQASAVQLFTLPTVTANGTFNFFVSLASNAPPIIYDQENGTLLEPGFKMLITSDQTSNNNGGGVNIEYSETAL